MTLRLPAGARSLVVIDLETNPDRAEPAEHEIIEIGGCLLTETGIEAEFATFVAPTRPLLAETTELTGIHDADLAGAPEPADALARLISFIGDHPIAAHNGFRYDFLVLDAALRRADRAPLENLRLDTLELAHLVFPRAGELMLPDRDGSPVPPGRRLDQLADHLGIERPEPAHRALADARLTASVLQALVAMLNRDAPDRRLQRWVLHQCGHAWAEFVEHPGADRPSLEDAIPEPEPWPTRVPSGTYDITAAVAPLQEGGAIVAAGRTARPQQVKMASLVAQSFAHRERHVIEAPTGTGKTLAYLVPSVPFARATGKPVVIATHSKVLQNQVVASTPDLGRAFGDPRIVVLKGRDNYISLDALDGALDDPDPDDAVPLAIMVAWSARTPSGEWDDLRTWAIERDRVAWDRLRWRLRVDSKPSPWPHSRLEELCLYRHALEIANNADVVVMNQALLVSHPDWFTSARNLVIDEAHNLEDAATAALSEEIGGPAIDHLLRTIFDVDRRRGAVTHFAAATGIDLDHPAIAGVVTATEAAKRAADAFATELLAYVRERSGARREEVERFGASYRLRRGFDTARLNYRPVIRAAKALSSHLIDVANALGELQVPETVQRPFRKRRLEQEIGRVGRAARSAAELVGSIPRCEGDDVWIHIADLRIESGQWQWGLRRVPITVAPQLRELWESLDAVVLTSATLRVAGEFGHIVGRLGLDEVRATALDSPFHDISRHHLLVLPDHLPTPRGSLLDEFLYAEADEIARLFTLTSGRGLGLFTARSRLEFVRDHARPHLDARQLPLLAQGDEPSPALVERMQADVRASLLATRSFWEGIDVPGEALSLLVIEKLPFDPPGDPIVDARMEALELRGRDPFAEYLVPQAVLRMVQGLGRLIRSETDVGVSVVLDKRLRKPVPYRETFLRSLPGPPTIRRPFNALEGYEAIAEHLGIVFDDELRAAIERIPSSDPWGKLDELALSEEEIGNADVVRARLEAVREIFGFESWRPGQLEVMERIIAGDDVLAVLPTGSGKSLTFQVPALLLPGLTLVISPLVALMRDQVQNLKGRGLARVGAIYSGMPQSEQEDVLDGARGGRYKLLYVSPERLWSGRFREGIRTVQVARVAVDEAHCISQWGHSFRPEYANIPAALDGIAADHGRPAIAALTATATEHVRSEIIDLLGLRVGDTLVRSPDRPELFYCIERCDRIEERDMRVVQILEGFRGRPVIVYVPRRLDTTRIAGLLRAANHSARPYHGGMEPPTRTSVEEAFRYGEVDVVVATKAFGLGIDKPDISAIVHLEMPASVEDYVQETGRAARGALTGDGPERGWCVLLSTPHDCRIHQQFIRSAAPSLEVVKAVWNVLGHKRTLVPPDDLANRAGLNTNSERRDPEPLDTDPVALAVHHLVGSGALVRREDVMWSGRVWIPGDVEMLLDDLEKHDRRLARHGRDLVRRIRALGTEEYDAMGWQRHLGIPAPELEKLLLELNRRDVLGLSAWRFAWQLERVPGVEPDWQTIKERCRQRSDIVRELSKAAREYASQDSVCRRAWLLRYLGAPAEPTCHACDVCQPDVERPWSHVEVTADALAAALPVRQIWMALLLDVDGRNFSIESLVRALTGTGRYTREYLEQHPTYGRLSLLGVEKARNELDKIVADGLATIVQLEHNGRPYIAVQLTPEGRAWR